MIFLNFVTFPVFRIIELMKLIALFILFLGISLSHHSCVQAQGEGSWFFGVNAIDNESFKASRDSVLNVKKEESKEFLVLNKSYSQELVFLIDMKIPSGKNRFFVLDLKKDSIIAKGLVAHGAGSTISEDSLVFSNTPNSYQTSLGKYKIGSSYAGNFGKSYKLHGLDKTNSKAFDRLVVLHPYQCVPDKEQEDPICESLGCPMVSNQFMEVLYTFIDNSKKPILMVIYY